MATTQELATAIKNAHAAGDAAAVRKLIPAYEQSMQQANQTPSLTPAEATEDVAKSAGQGLRSVAESTVGQFGDIPAALGGMVEKGVGYVASPEDAKKAGQAAKTGADVVSGAPTWLLRRGYKALTGDTSETPLASPSSGDVSKAVTEKTGVEPYQPKSKIGKYTKTGTEFAASGLAGPNRFRNIAQGFFGGLLSEGAGQATEGTDLEPWARIAGGLIVPTGQVATNALRRGPTTEAARLLEEQGIPLTAGQATGRQGLHTAESEIGGDRFHNIVDQQKAAYTSRVLEGAGAPPGSVATPEVMAETRRNLGAQFDRMAAGTPVPFDQPLQNDLLSAATNYAESAPSVVPAVESVMNRMGTLAARNGGVLAGQNYQEMTTYLRELAEVADAPTQTALNQMRDALDDAVERSLGPDQRAQWGQTRNQYRNLLTAERSLTGAGQDAAEGVISPTRLRTSIGAQGGPASIAEGRSDLVPLANAGVSAMKPPPNSGTAARSQARGIGIPVVSELWGAGKGAALMSPTVQNLLRQAPEPQGRAALAAIIAAQQGQAWEGY